MRADAHWFPTTTPALLGISLLIVVGLVGSLNATELDSFLADIKDRSATVSSLHCNFKQTKKLAMFKSPIIFHGNLAVERPDKLRWEFTAPVKSALIFNGQKGIRCNEGQDPARFNLDSDPVMAMVAKQLWTWLSGDYMQLRDEYDLQLADNRSLRIIPRKKETARMIKSITIDFDTSQYHPNRVVIEEPGGDSTTIEFFNYRLDPPLSETIFASCRLE